MVKEQHPRVSNDNEVPFPGSSLIQAEHRNEPFIIGQVATITGSPTLKTVNRTTSEMESGIWSFVSFITTFQLQSSG